MRLMNWKDRSLVIAIATCLLCWNVAGAQAQEEKPIEDITGDWVAKDDPTETTLTISSKDDGLLMIQGSDKKSKFQSACISFGPFAKCVGHGITLGSGAGFISESFIRLSEKGEMFETWLVRSSEEELSGQTLWVRKK